MSRNVANDRHYMELRQVRREGARDLGYLREVLNHRHTRFEDKRLQIPQLAQDLKQGEVKENFFQVDMSEESEPREGAQIHVIEFLRRPILRSILPLDEAHLPNELCSICSLPRRSLKFTTEPRYIRLEVGVGWFVADHKACKEYGTCQFAEQSADEGQGR